MPLIKFFDNKIPLEFDLESSVWYEYDDNLIAGIAIA